MRHCLLFTSHSLTVQSSLPLARRAPSGLKATDQTRPVCPCNVMRHSPVLTSHSLTLPSSLPLARRAPSELKATDQTRPACPWNVMRHSPVLTSHTLTVPSSLLLARRAPSGLKVTDRIQLVCPCSILRHCPVPPCQIPTTIPLFPARFVSQCCQQVRELLLNGLLTFEQHEQARKNRLEDELCLSVPHVLFRLRLHQAMAK